MSKKTWSTFRTSVPEKERERILHSTIKQDCKKWSIARKLQKKLLIRKLEKSTEKNPVKIENFHWRHPWAKQEKLYICVEERWVLDPNDDTYNLAGMMIDGIVKFYIII